MALTSITTIFMLLYALFLIVFGAVLLLVPERVQRYVIRHLGQTPNLNFGFVKNFVKSSAYLWNVRSVGLIALSMGLFLLFVL
jgi:hypothetical protein